MPFEILALEVQDELLITYAYLSQLGNWLLNWAIAYSTPYLVNDGPGNANLQSKVFFIWGSFCFVCISFVWFCIYETKGLSLEEVDELYARVSKAWESTKFVPEVKFSEVQKDGRNLSIAEAAAEVERSKSETRVVEEKGLA